MTFFEAAAKCYRKYVSYRGRASKSEFWWFFLLFFLFAWPLLLSEFQSGTWVAVLSFMYFILTLSAIIPLTAVFTRRMHDLGRTGASWLVIFFPIFGVLTLLYWTLQEGKEEENKYGLPDNKPVVSRQLHREEKIND